MNKSQETWCLYTTIFIKISILIDFEEYLVYLNEPVLSW